MIVIIDYGIGNLHSIKNALDYLGIDSEISKDSNKIKSADKLILPGVGAFEEGIKNLEETGLIPVIKEKVKSGTPILGVCLGMQLLATKSFENGEWDGLNLLEGEVVKITPSDSNLKIPHVGWNEVNFVKKSHIFSELGDKASYYFVNSYYVKTDEKFITGTFQYGGEFTATIQKENVFGTQFHPEKSKNQGLKILENFACYKKD